MQVTFKKVASTVLAGSVLVSFSGCSFLDKSKEEVTLAATEYCNAITGLDADTIEEKSADDLGEIGENLEDLLDISEGELYTADAAKLCGAIAKTLSYEIDEESVEADGKEGTGSVDVTFSLVDIEKLMEVDAEDMDDLIDAIPDVDTKDIEVTLELVKEDDVWKVEDVEDLLEEVYDFTGLRFFFAFGEALEEEETLQAEAAASGEVQLYGASFIGCDETDFDNNIGYASTDAGYIAVSHAYGTSNGEPDFTGYHAEVTLNGEVVATSEDEVFCAVYTYDEPLEAGEYHFTFYDADDVIFSEATIIVE
jgi:hypothetical protein